ncbi:LysR family transcriptional regulator [Streptomyces sp. NPDC051956]|uniref:LysR family transcriptional regulator n=1 Tax=Streptomyces sp. NPDC051956 TaxID=3365677 RepID=UPI0037CF731D
MQLQQLRVFCEVATELSFTQAARNLHYAQSSVTAQIKNLEEAVGASLFDRSRRRLALTAAGVCLLPHAEQIIEMTELARKDVERTSRAAQVYEQHARRRHAHPHAAARSAVL